MFKKNTEKGFQTFSQKAFIFNKDGKFLTMRRTETAPSNPLKWDLPGGDVEFGEQPYKSMAREIKEETGLIVKNLRVFDIEARIIPERHHITIAYRADVSKGKLKMSYEHDLYKWVSLNDFSKLDIPKKLRRFAETLNLKTY